MRVILAQKVRMVLMLRITPAHAGNTEYNKLMNAQEEDHPRACG